MYLIQVEDNIIDLDEVQVLSKITAKQSSIHNKVVATFDIYLKGGKSIPIEIILDIASDHYSKEYSKFIDKALIEATEKATGLRDKIVKEWKGQMKLHKIEQE